MLSYQSCGLSAGHIFREKHIKLVFLVYLIMKPYFLLHIINKTYKFYKIYRVLKIMSKIFLELNTLRFKIEKNATENML